jgi:hypothetical protein
MPMYWLSMAPEDGPGRVAIVDAGSPAEAHQRALALRLPLPGDEILILMTPDGEPGRALPRDRILTQEELDSVGAESAASFDDEEWEQLMDHRRVRRVR